MLLLVIIIELLGICRCSQDNNAFVLHTERLPNDLNFMPTLGNGHLGFTIYGDAIYMNGLYNGRAGDSRRARIPNWLNVSLQLDAEAPSPVYELQMQEGYFRSLHNTTDGSGGRVLIEQRSYAHRYYTRALVYELLVQREDAKTPLDLHLKLNPGSGSTAFHWRRHGAEMIRASTRRREHPEFQKRPRTVFIAFSERLRQREEKRVRMHVNETELYYRYVLTIDENANVARMEMAAVMATDTNVLLELHAAEWRKFWQDFCINVAGNLELSRTINAGIFYLANALPSPHTNQPKQPYFGLSPTGLGRGHLDADYEGHNFWDTEIWMLPVVSQLDPNWSKALFEYRRLRLTGAKYNALLSGFKGARFPWESAYTGTEVTNPCCPEVAQQEVHISADIAFALQQFYATINDREWLCTDAWPLLESIAEFLVSRVELDMISGVYHIKGVMGPDEDHSNVTDNVYTNVVFKMALQFASYAAQQCAPESLDFEQWQEVEAQLVVLYDPLLDYHPQHLGYAPPEQIKQADVVLLGFPLQLQMNRTTRLNDLHIYENVTRATGPAMTWSMFAINYRDVGDDLKADYFFDKSYMDYVRPEFKVWSENKIGLAGSANFLTGIGGFLQAIIAGYGGLRFLHDSNTNIMEIRPTRLLPNTEEFEIQGLKFANATFSLNVKSNRTILECLTLGEYPLQFQQGLETSTVHRGFKTEFNETVTIRTTATEK